MMNHSLIKYQITHQRLVPKPHKFIYNFFWFKIDLTNLDNWPTKWLGINKFSLYGFYDKDHLNLGFKTLKENYSEFVKSKGFAEEVEQITIYTQVRFLGYVFNPVCFVLIRGVMGSRCAIVEVGNTFNELKPYYVSPDQFSKYGFQIDFKKFFYISPFIDHDTNLKLMFNHKKDNLKISIDDYKSGKTILKVFLKGKEKKATNQNLLGITIAMPFITFKTIILIHYQALILWVKGIRFRRKSQNKELQKGFLIWKT